MARSLSESTTTLARSLAKSPWVKRRQQPDGITRYSPTEFGGTSIAPSPLKKNYPLAAPFAPPADSSITSPSDSLAGKTFAPLLDTLHGIGRPTIAPFAPIAPRFEGQAPVAVTRPNPSYYENLYAAKLNPLSQDYFGRGGLSDQAVDEASRRGLMTAGPSGVAGQLYEKTIVNPFAREAANIQNQINIIRTETEMDLAKYDTQRQDDFRKFQSDLITKDRDYGVASVEAQSRIDNTYLALESEISSAIASGATEERLAELNAQVATFNTLIAAEREKTRLVQEAAQEEARLQEERVARQGRWWLEASGIPGAFSGGEGENWYEAPYEDLDQPRPYTGAGLTASPSNTGPSWRGTSQDQRAIGSDGQIYAWDVPTQEWIRI